jgi:hypothetical protein
VVKKAMELAPFYTLAHRELLAWQHGSKHLWAKVREKATQQLGDRSCSNTHTHTLQLPCPIPVLRGA